MKSAFPHLRSFKVAALTVCLLPAANFAVAEKLDLSHSVYLGGLYLGSVKTHIEQTDKSYDISSDALSNQSLKWMLNWVADARSYGNIENATLKPQQHAHKSNWNGKKRGAVIDYSAEGKVDFKIVGKPQTNFRKYTPLDSDTLPGSLDPMTMLLSAATKLQNGEGCKGSYPVFDGHRRYDVILSDAPARHFNASRYSVFSGNAVGCKIAVDKKGGFRREVDYDPTANGDLVLWVASPVAGGRIVPVRMEVKTPIGAMELHLERYNQGAVKLASKTAQ